MREYSHKLLDKALDAIEAAEVLVDTGKSDIGADGHITPCFTWQRLY